MLPVKCQRSISGPRIGAIPMVVAGTYNPYLVALSILVASVASYTALDLGGHVAAARGLARRAWLVAAAITMGGGIWSMHFIGMLAFVMPIPMSYDIGLTALSLVVAVVVTGGGFYVISRPGASPLRLALSGLFMGLGIVAMHYTGMAAMRGHAELGYQPLFVALSVVIAIGASTAALWLALQTTDPWQKLMAALVMGVAISGMHYTGMRAAIFTAHGAVDEAPVIASLDQINLALAIAGITFVILALASIASLSEQKRAELAIGLPRIMGDRVQLQQVVMNLMSNGIDAMKDMAGPRELAITSQRADGEQLMVSVSDTGVGLPPQQAEEIFNAFVTTKLDGTGMGLSISRSIVESHSGRLWAADNAPRGACFRLVLPTKVE